MTFIKLPFVIKIFILSMFEWSFYTGFTVKEKSILSQQPVKGKMYIHVSWVWRSHDFNRNVLASRDEVNAIYITNFWISFFDMQL